MAIDTVNIVNANWNRVNVDARIGNNQDPMQNRSLGSKILLQNQTWAIQSEGESVFYRRDNDPDNPDGSMTDWTERPCYGQGETYEEDI